MFLPIFAYSPLCPYKTDLRGQIIMSNLFALLAPTTDSAHYAAYRTVSFILIALMGIAAIVSIILVLMQPSNSTGIDALGGSSETFFGKNKGKSIEERMKKWTWICLVILGVLSVAFFVVQRLPW